MSKPLSHTPATAASPLATLLFRLHFYIGLLIGPFLLVAALSGVLYALTPQLEDHLYAQALYTDSRGPALPLAQQIEAAQARVGPEAQLAVVRPAPAPGRTTRVMFHEPGQDASEHRALFVDPVSGEIRDDLAVYGTSGVLPLRTWIDQFHRALQLGEWGRLYSELAASWLWVIASGGLLLWLMRRRSAATVSAARRWHSRVGLLLLIGLLFFSATGLTWSQWAGSNIGLLRAEFGWGTPTVSTNLSASAQSHAGVHGEHAHHGAMRMMHAHPIEPGLFDSVLATARNAGIDAAKVEIVAATSPDKAWTVTEIDRRWPTQVDAVAIDPQHLMVTDRANFADYSLPAKLTRWGIDAHMGILFGVANQLLLIVVASGLAAMVVWGYVMTWRRARRSPNGVYQGSWQTFKQLSRPAQAVTFLLALVLGLGLPVLGVSLVLFLLVDAAWVALRVRDGALA
jgi:uncharacterized iron-regulated membrane protein